MPGGFVLAPSEVEGYSIRMKKVCTEKDVSAIAEIIIERITKHRNKTGATIVTLSGDLGTGKTTLTQAIAEILGITQKVVSPTFTILKTYIIKKQQWSFLHHIDAYRLEKPEEILKLGWGELIENPENLIIVEWPEKISKLLPKDIYTITLSHTSNMKREIDYM